MIPPQNLNVIDQSNVPGFSALTFSRGYHRRPDGSWRHGFPDVPKILAGEEPAKNVMQAGNTLWRPACVLDGREPTGALVCYHEKSFYQTDNDVTVALYRVKGYRYLVPVWFSNKDGHRIA